MERFRYIAYTIFIKNKQILYLYAYRKFWNNILRLNGKGSNIFRHSLNVFCMYIHNNNFIYFLESYQNVRKSCNIIKWNALNLDVSCNSELYTS